MLRKLLLTVLVTTFPIIAMSQAGMSVGVMNPELVMDAMPETTEIQRDLEQFVQQKQQEFQQEYSVWIEAVTSYEERVESGQLTGQQRQLEEQELMEREQELESLEQRMQGEIQNRQNELVGPLMQRVENAMNAVAGEMDLDYVINTQTSQGDPVVFFTSERGVDITERVIELLSSN